MHYSPPGSSVHGILQARILEWLPCPPAGDLADPGIEHRSPALQADSLLAEPQGKPSYRSDLNDRVQGKGVREGEVQKKKQNRHFTGTDHL